MRYRLHPARDLRLGGCALVLLLGSPARGDLQQAYEEALARGDWATAAETAIRRLEANPEQVEIHGHIAQARWRGGDREGCELWLKRWETAGGQPAAEMLTLQGELARADGNLGEAQALWLRSYEEKADAVVARRLTNRDLWKEERLLYESWMTRVANDFQFVDALRVSAEAAVRGRRWEELAVLIDVLNELGTRSAMKEAAAFENVVAAKALLAEHDEAIGQQASGPSLSRRAQFFLTHELLELASEDARAALARCPRLVLPKITLAVCHFRRSEYDAVRTLRVITRGNLKPLSEKRRSAIDNLDETICQSVVSPRVYLDRALELASSRQTFLALDDLEAAGPGLRDSAVGWALRGKCLSAQGDAQGAMQAFKRALEKDPENVRAWAGLASLAMARADYAEAIQRYQWLTVHAPEGGFDSRLERARERFRTPN